MKLKKIIAGTALVGLLGASLLNTSLTEEKIMFGYQGANGYDVRVVRQPQLGPFPSMIKMGIGTLDPKTKAFKGPMVYAKDINSDGIDSWTPVGDIGNSLRNLCSWEKLEAIMYEVLGSK